MSKCDSCENKRICKYTENMKEYEENVLKNVIDDMNYLGDFPIKINVICDRYKRNCLNNELCGYREPTIKLLDNSDSVDKTILKSGDLGVIRAGMYNTKLGLEYDMGNKIKPTPPPPYKNPIEGIFLQDK